MSYTELITRLCGRALPVLMLTLAPLATPGRVGAQPAPNTPAALIKWSMGKYAAMPTFRADCAWSVAYPTGPGSSATRTIQYAKPNQYKIVSAMAMGMMTQTSVSDGKTLVEYAVGAAKIPAQTYTAPTSLADAGSMYIQNPMFCGSLLYKFFGGPEKYASLINATKMPLTFGPAVTLDGQACKTVMFWAQGMYGKTEIAIGAQDGLVHRIRYGSEPLMEQTKKMMQSGEFQAMMKKMGGANGKDLPNTKDMMKLMPTTSQTTEMYEKITVGQPIASTVFSAKVPTGQQVLAAGGGSAPKPPVPLGKRAPEITVTSVNGVKQKLADFKGKVVLIDFWATWCPPCRKGLPETQKFYTDYGKKGLAVLTISDEAKPTVTAFLKQNKYIFPAYLDKGGVTNKAYHIEAIPTTVVIDKNGNLVAYMVGLSPKEDILAALKKAGL